MANNYANCKAMFLIQIDDILSRIEFLRTFKTNQHLTIALFSHKYNNDKTGVQCGSNQQTYRVNNWFKRRWKAEQKR